MKRTEILISRLFAGLGIAMLLGAAAFAWHMQQFKAGAHVAEGQVAALEASGKGYRPIVRFQAENGDVVEFRSSTSSSPPAYEVGERVRVLYPPGKPYDAEIDGFLALWLGPLILGGIGFVFAAIGLAFVVVRSGAAKRAATLLREGRPVATQLQNVDLDRSYRVNGVNPFRVYTQWQDPASNEIHVFRSEALWFDPSQWLQGRDITVFIDKQKPSRYHMDLSFLPKQAD